MNAFVCLQVAALMSAGACVHASTVSTFDTDTEGWFVVGPQPYSHIGNQSLNTQNFTWDAGSIRVADLFVWTWGQAPAKFLGSRGDALGQSLAFDILIRYSDGVPYPAVALVGAAKTLYFATDSPPVGVWHHVAIPLTSGGWRVNVWDTGAIATQDEMIEVLSDLRGLYILTEWLTGPDDTNLDNIVMPGSATNPCPGDLNGDGQVDDADFVLFIAAYNTLDCADPTMPPGCPADFNQDGVVEDADFVIFVAAYNELVCP